MGFTSRLFPTGIHMCYIFNNEKERRLIVSRYLESGLLNHEKVAYFADVVTPAQLDSQLAAVGIDGGTVAEAGQLLAARADEAYCPDGVFTPERMMERLAEMYRSGIGQGYHGARIGSEMGWARRGRPGSERLIEYEALQNEAVERHPITLLCQYDANRFDGATLYDVLTVHPMVIMRGHLVHNPYYIPPRVFLASREKAGGA